MAERVDEGGVLPAGVALIGGLAVVIFYWIHNAVLAVEVLSESGIEITLFAAAFLSQYIPLKILEGRLELKDHH
jgi:hypothetical protein